MNILKLGDCLEVMKDIPDGSIDMVLCDLPYGTTARNEWDKQIPIKELWEQYERIVKENGAICLFAQLPFDKYLSMSNLKMLRYEWIWEKQQGTGHLNAKKNADEGSRKHIGILQKTPNIQSANENGETLYLQIRARVNELPRTAERNDD